MISNIFGIVKEYIKIMIDFLNAIYIYNFYKITVNHHNYCYDYEILTTENICLIGSMNSITTKLN
jgi:hypothetical protein